MEDTGNIVIYESEGGDVRLDVRLEDETVWLSQEQMSMLFDKSLSTINYHINNIFKEGELDKDMVIRKIRITSPLGAIEGLFQQNEVTVYNLDVIISVGYRVHSIAGTRFRLWATKRLHEYIVKGFTMDDERLKQLGGGGYWKELLNRIRDIRASEKVFYRQILDIYATSVDYDPKADMSIEFFKKVQNKIHYAIHGQTAAEIIYSRADADADFLTHKEINIAEFARSIGMNATLLRNYINGFKEPSAEREKAILAHIHQLGQELMAANF